MSVVSNHRHTHTHTEASTRNRRPGVGGKLLLMDGKVHADGVKLESCERIEAPWRMQVDISALAKARSS